MAVRPKEVRIDLKDENPSPDKKDKAEALKRNRSGGTDADTLENDKSKSTQPPATADAAKEATAKKRSLYQKATRHVRRFLKRHGTYQTNQVAVLYSIPLGISYKVIMLGSFIASLTVMFVNKSHMYTELPSVIRSLKVVRGAVEEDKVSDSMGALSRPIYCNNASFAYKGTSATAVYEDVGCVDNLSDAEVDSETGQYYHITSFLEQFVVQTDCPPGAFVSNIEDMFMEMSISYQATWTDVLRPDTIKVWGRHSNQVLEFNGKTDFIVVQLKALLDMAGLNLDEPNPVPPVAPGYNPPSYRMSGGQLVLNCVFFQRLYHRTVELKIEVAQRGNQDFRVINTNVFYEPTSQVRRYYGIRLFFQTQGKVGEFRLDLFWFSLVDVIIMLTMTSLAFDALVHLFSPAVRAKKIEMALSNDLLENLKTNFTKYRMAINPNLLRVSLPEGDKSYSEAMAYHESAMMTLAHFSKKRLDLIEAALADMRDLVKSTTVDTTAGEAADGGGGGGEGRGYFPMFRAASATARAPKQRASVRVRRLEEYNEAVPVTNIKSEAKAFVLDDNEMNTASLGTAEDELYKRITGQSNDHE